MMVAALAPCAMALPPNTAHNTQTNTTHLVDDGEEDELDDLLRRQLGRRAAEDLGHDARLRDALGQQRLDLRVGARAPPRVVLSSV